MTFNEAFKMSLEQYKSKEKDQVKFLWSIMQKKFKKGFGKYNCMRYVQEIKRN